MWNEIGRRPRRALLWPVALLASALTGCGSGLYPVEGKVLYDDGKPAVELAGGFVSFQPTEHETSSQGSIHADGTFVLSTHREADGALPGKYKVLITPPPFDDGGGARPQVLVDSIYSSPETTPLTAEVAPRRNEPTLTIPRPKARPIAVPN